MDIEEAKEQLLKHKKEIDEKYISARYSKAIEVVLSELEKKDKRLKRQFKILTKRDKQIEEIKQIAHNDFEERCKLTFKIEELENKLDKQEKIIKDIDAMSEYGNSINEVIEYFANKVEIKKLDETIKNKQEKIKELDDLLQDKEKRWDKVKKYIEDIYNIDL